ncbi:MAG: hypothetical protein NPIRA02_06950 [Nitrospirales bacterium]|nr:MAG: hypothetical protein NPIRA02_06950 [Nitrospirales bacterium]
MNPITKTSLQLSLFGEIMGKLSKSHDVMNKVIGIVCMTGFLLVSGFVSSFECLASAQAARSAEGYMKTAKEAYHKGVVGSAALQWTEAAHLYEKEGNLQGQAQALLYLGQSLTRMGHINKAILTFDVAKDLANQGNDKPLMARILGSLGNSNFLLGREKEAVDYLTQGLELARVEALSAQTGVLLNDVGNVQFALKQYNSALEAYIESAVLSEQTGNDTLSFLALINAAMAEIKGNLYHNAHERLELALSRIQSIPDSHDKAQGLLKIGLAYEDLRKSLVRNNLPPSTALTAMSQADSQTGKPDLVVMQKGFTREASEEMDDSGVVLNKSVMAFQQAITVGKKLGDHRAESYGHGYLGRVYEHESDWHKSLTHTRQALHLGQRMAAPELNYRWQWQIARVHRKANNDDEAMTAYRSALNTLHPIRQELLAGYQGRRPPFRVGIGSLFFEYIDLLLHKASTTSSPLESQAYLGQAQKILEEFNAAELQDYFQDQCVETVKTQRLALEHVPKAKSTAVIYPVILPGRLELLVRLPSELKTYRVGVKAQLLTQTIHRFRDSLEDHVQGATESTQHAQQLYDWLIRPLLKDLMEASINVLVFVPDGPLQTVPFAPLHDRIQNRYLIDQFALAVTPGISLTDLRPMDSANVRILGLGLSETVRGFQSLQWVTEEMKALEGLFPSTILLDQEFQVSNMDRELKSQQYNVVHIATHGKVQAKVNDSFVQAFDQKITMDRLADMIGVYKFGAQPLELLTLSACETAAGDDRAALGLAGIAIKAGAKSALASLWPIDDEATSKLVSEFYRQISEDPTTSKAVALQRAQQILKRHPQYRHPRYWSPFLLIGNWL